MSEFGLRSHDEDPVDRALPEDLRAIHTGDWINLVFRMRIPIGRYGVAIALARFADSDGANVFPGLNKVADIAKMDVRNAGVHVRALVSMGMLAVKRKGGGRAGNPTLYRLTRPADITTLPLWLDPEMNRVADGAGFAPVKSHAYSMTLASGESTEHRTPASGEYPFDATERRMPASGESAEHRTLASDETPVDNSAAAETPDVQAGNTGRYEQKHRTLASEDLTITRPTKDLPGSSQATTSLGWRDRAAPPAALAALVEPPDVEPWVPSPAPAAAAEPPAEHTAAPPGPRAYTDPAPRHVVHASATLAASPAIEAIFALLDAQPGGGEWYFAGAARELRRDGIPNPTRLELAVRAAAILRRSHPDTETRSA